MTIKLPDFEHLSALAQENPEKLESIRRNCVESIIESAPHEMRRRLRGLQFQIDCRRELHAHPLGACIEISKMMYESLHKLNEALCGRSPASPEPLALDDTATVLPFSKLGSV